jgi:hypothetical protein
MFFIKPRYAWLYFFIQSLLENMFLFKRFLENQEKQMLR